MLFTFPSRYSFSIAHTVYFALADGPACFRQDFSCPAVLTIPSHASHTSLTRLSLSLAVLPCTFCCVFPTLMTVLLPRISPVWAFSPFARRYSGNHCCFLFLRVLRCFSSPGTSPFRDDSLPAAGFPHSDTDGSLPPYGSPSHFAVWHVLLQYSVARHPPCALPCLI